MRQPSRTAHQPLDKPQLIDQASQLIEQWRAVSRQQLMQTMHLSEAKAKQVQAMLTHWTTNLSQQTAAIDTFVGDIYSGLQVPSWQAADRQYAHRHLLILSGLYGGLRACDGVMPYRLEMGYKLPNGDSLYDFWGDAIAKLIPTNPTTIINLSAVEYTKAVLPYTTHSVITPKFLTVNATTGKPSFVTVHTKIARGALASWLIVNRVTELDHLANFAELNYRYSPADSTPQQPVYICQQFGGLGLSVRS